MSEAIERIIIQLQEEIKQLKTENNNLNEKLEEYTNKFSTYTKEQACLLFKIQEVKKIILDSNISKSGRNNFNDYDYYELEDINKPICDALVDKGLSSLFSFRNEYGYLQIIDKETGAWIQWSTPLKKSERYMAQFSTKSGKKGDVGDIMKDEQALQTYARRALYLQALEIAEPNSIEQEGNNKTSKKNTPKRNKDNDTFTIPEDTDIVTKGILEQIQKDFGNNVPYTKKTIQNKLKSMKEHNKIDEKMYTKAMQRIQR